LFHLLMSAQTPNLFILSQQSYRWKVFGETG
jgi:hypothetical protein